MSVINEINGPSRGLYIGVWLLAGFIGGIVSAVLDVILAELLISDYSDLSAYLIASGVWGGVILAIAWIVIYDRFKRLNLHKVRPYMVVLGGLGSVAGYIRTSSEWTDAGLEPPALLLLSLTLSWAIWLGLFSWHFSRQGRL